MGILLELAEEAMMLGSMMFGCMFLDCRCAGRPRPKGVMLGASLSGEDSVSSSMLWDCVLGVLFKLGDVASMTGSKMLGLSRLDLHCVWGLCPRGFMMGGAVPGVLFLVFRRCVRSFVFIVVGTVGFFVVVIGGAIWLTL